MWTENNLTDCLAAPDGGLIKQNKDETMKIVEEKRCEMKGEWLDKTDPVSTSTRRIITVNAYAEAYKRF